MRLILTAILLSSVFTSPNFADDTNDGIVRIQSQYDVATTADRLIDALNAKGMTIFARIDHSKNAQDAGMELRPTELVIFGNPKVGTLLMKCSQSVAIDLPQKALIWKDESGHVWLSYNSPKYLADRHAIDNCEETLAKVTGSSAESVG